MFIYIRDIGSDIRKSTRMELQILDVSSKIWQKNDLEKKDSENTKHLPNTGYIINIKRANRERLFRELRKGDPYINSKQGLD